MGKKDKSKKKGKGTEKTAMKTDKKAAAKQKKLLEKIGEADISEVVARLEEEEARLKSVIETVCLPPSPRSSFTFIAHPEKEELVLFGGEFFNGQKICIYNDLYFYNIQKNEWKKVQSPGGPTPRSGHQMVALASDGGQLWLFGGEHASPSQLQFYHYKDLWVMRLKSKTWEKINAPNGPSPRSGHRMVASKKKLFVFGGFHDNNQSYRYHNDVHIFSLESYTWLKFDIVGAIVPPQRSGCCMAACPDGKILVWGGYSKSQVRKDVDRGITHTDMFLLNQDSFETTSASKVNSKKFIPEIAPNDKFKWTTVKAGGIKPLPRSSVGCTVAANSKAYCFGGVMDTEEDEEDLRGQFGDDLYCLDLTSPTWRLLEISTTVKQKKDDVTINARVEETPAAQSSTDGIFTITVAGSSTGGKSTMPLKLKTKTGPSPRMNPGLCVCKGTLYIFGGIYEEDSKQYTYNDFYSIDLHKMDEWKTIIQNNSDPHDWIDSESGESSSDDGSDDDDDDMSDDSDSESDMQTD